VGLHPDMTEDFSSFMNLANGLCNPDWLMVVVKNCFVRSIHKLVSLIQNCGAVLDFSCPIKYKSGVSLYCKESY